MKKGYTHVTMVLDRSGSMGNQWDDISGGYPELIEEQKKGEGECTFSLFAFDDEHDIVEDFTKIEDVNTTLEIRPRGMTALRDAIGRSIVKTGEKLRDLPENERPEKVVFFIQTDGYENSSQEFDQDSIKKLVKEQEEKYNWQFIFMGAGEECLDQAQHMGFKSENTVSYNYLNTCHTGNVSTKLASIRSLDVSAADLESATAYSEAERESLK